MLLYAILCHARTGSNWLASVLNQHPEITGHNELFHERALFFHNAQIRDEAIIRERDRDPVGYLQTAAGDWLHIEYRDLYQAETYRRIFAFLGVAPDVPLQRDIIHKQNTSKIAERFQQPHEVHDYLRRNDLIFWAQEPFH